MGSDREPHTIEPFVEPLTKREREILFLLADGLSNREIADRLTLALSSVKWYVQQIYRKLGVTNRRQSVSRARALGLFDQDMVPSKPLHNLPLRLTSLVGREKEIHALERLLLKPEFHLITLTGPGGIGKTRLAIQSSVSVLPAFPNGVWFISLDSLPSPEFLTEAIGAALELSFSGQVPPAEQLLESLRRKELLLVLDSFEHLLPEGTNLLVEILHEAPGVKLLVTSRERLSLQAEWVFEVHGLDFPKNGQDVAIETYPAIALFLQRARQASTVASTREEELFVKRIAQLVEGMPLALELAAAWARALSFREIAGEIERGLDFLQARQPDLAERHRSMLAVFNHSWQLLSEEDRAIFRKLSVFQGGFDREAAGQVAGASLDILATLVDKSLIYHLPNGRYRIHELLRQYAAVEMEKAVEAESTRERHLAYFLGLAEQAGPELWRAQQKTWLDRLEIEHDNLRAALEWSLSPQSQLGVQAGLSLVAAIQVFWRIRGYFSEAAGWLEALLAHPRAVEWPKAFANGLRLAGSLDILGFGRSEAGRSQFQRSLAIVETEGDPLLLAHVLCDYGNFYREEGSLDTATAYLERSLGLYKDQGDQPGIALALRRLGQVMFAGDDPRRARSNYLESIQIWKEIGNKSELAQTLLVLGRAYFSQGQYAEAQAAFDESIILSRDVGDKWRVARALSFRGWLEFSAREIGPAVASLEESLRMYRDLGLKVYIAVLLFNLGEIARYQGNYPEALSLFEEALKIARETGNKAGQIWVLISKGFIFLRQGNSSGAFELLKEGLLLSREVGSSFDSAIAMIGVAGVLAAGEEMEGAARLLGAAQALIESTPITVAGNPADLAEYELIHTEVRALLGESKFDRLNQEGRALAAEGLDQVIAFAWQNIYQGDKKE